MSFEPREAAIVLRIFKEFADGNSESRIVKGLNAEEVHGRRRSKRGWSPSTVHRVLRNKKYIGRWIWNRSETRRDPKTGRRRQFAKPESEWFITEGESLRVVPQPLWDHVQERLLAVQKTWPGGRGRRGFEGQQGGRVRLYPTNLLSGAMKCGTCGSAMAKVSGKDGGYYGCLGAAKGACDNHTLVRRTLLERVVLAAVRDRLTVPANIDYVLERLAQEVAIASAGAPEEIRLREAEFETEQRRVGNLVEFIAEGRGSRALADALRKSEQRVEELHIELEALRRSRDVACKPPPREWVEQRIATLQEILERRTERSALLLTKVLGPVTMGAVKADVGAPTTGPFQLSMYLLW